MTSPLVEALATPQWPANRTAAWHAAQDTIRAAARTLLAGQPIQWCHTHRNEAYPDWQGDDDDNPVFNGFRCTGGSWIEGANAWDCHITSMLLCTPPT